jgi:hypothetical protein
MPDQTKTRLAEIRRELQRIILRRYVQDNVVPETVGDPNISDESLTEQAQEALGAFFAYHQRLKSRWEAELLGGCYNLDGVLMTAARAELRIVGLMIRQGHESR